MPGLCLLSSFGNAEIIVSTRDRDVNLIEGVINIIGDGNMSSLYVGVLHHFCNSVQWLA